MNEENNLEVGFNDLSNESENQFFEDDSAADMATFQAEHNFLSQNLSQTKIDTPKSKDNSLLIMIGAAAVLLVLIKVISNDSSK